ncbi:MAG TPA: exodeoxyribonuclease VII large subunit [Thermomicrobiaceae bacterium]|nr:exodeoxyribonuclease VII large subunit [Thermomicrobiaceae bacterium]
MRAPRVLDVAEVTAYIKDLLEGDPVLGDVWIRGEITNFTRSAAGHIYFSLRTASAQLRCVLFRGSARYLTFQPGNGDAVIAHGNVSLYENTGQYQLYVDLVQPEGAGILQLQFEELRRRLAMEGLFEPSRKRPLPAFPRRIGVVTSATGAVWHDIQTVLGRRFPLCELILSPALVQGAEAPASIVNALRALDDDGRCDLVIVARGGGSMEDLACFNDERVARAVFGCGVPVVSAVGHETDVTICDLVADLRAPTPSAAAELVAPHVRELEAELAARFERAEAAMLDTLAGARANLDGLRYRLQRRSPEAEVRRQQLVVDGHARHLDHLMSQRLQAIRTELQGNSRQLELLHPLAVLGRGYAMVIDGVDETRLRDAAALQQGRSIVLQFHDGEAGASVEWSAPTTRGFDRAHTTR